jgi:N-acyl-D-aspartate/D-glutamate deacylase
MFDLIIRGGKIIDGTGSPYYYSDVGISDGKIAKIGKNLSGAKKVIGAEGLIVTPGFIDSHSHSDAQILTRPDMDLKIEQGITMSIAGQCGSSFVPLPKSEDRATYYEIEELGNTYDIRTDPDLFFKTVGSMRFGSSTALLIGHGSLRRAVMGTENRAPSASELEEMKELLRQYLKRGALGLSFGFAYVPGAYASTEEAIELAKVVSEYNKIVAAHIRDEGNYLVRAVKEFLTILKTAKVRGVLSHHKAATSEENWGKVTHTLRMLEEANKEGVEVYCDIYPYTACHTSLRAVFLPKEDLSAGLKEAAERLCDPDYRETIRKRNYDRFGDTDYNWVLVSLSKAEEYRGKRIPEIAEMLGKEPIDAIMDVMQANALEVSACFFTACEEDLKTVMAYPRCMICTDSGLPASTFYHPRVRASFPRALGRYVREEKVVPLHEMIRKMTSMPARVYGLKGKGLIWEGMDADICIFDENEIMDQADYTDCMKRARGLSYVILGGDVVVEDAFFNGTRNGKF